LNKILLKFCALISSTIFAVLAAYGVLEEIKYPSKYGFLIIFILLMMTMIMISIINKLDD
jgi:hypothetical protein